MNEMGNPVKRDMCNFKSTLIIVFKQIVKPSTYIMLDLDTCELLRQESRQIGIHILTLTFGHDSILSWRLQLHT